MCADLPVEAMNLTAQALERVAIVDHHIERTGGTRE